MNNIQEQKPFTTNQISNPRPNVPKTVSKLSGYKANSFNGGKNKAVACEKIMAGSQDLHLRFKGNFKMLTPLTPVYQNLKLTARVYFVPDSRVWKNAEKYIAQRGGASEIKITEKPNFGGKMIPYVYTPQEDVEDTKIHKYTSLTNTELWRDSFISSYIPRIGTFNLKEKQINQNLTQEEIDKATLPKIDALPLRGRIAIYNDLERNKEYEPEILEYNDDTVSNEEWQSYLPNGSNYDFFTMRARRENNYYTDYRTEIQGFELDLPEDLPASNSLKWLAFENKLAESRAQANNAQKTDWEILKEIRGSKLLTEGKVQLIGQQTFNLNYASITQNTYNNNETININFRVLGQQGAYSYTEVDLPLYFGVEFVEEGYIHVIFTASADTVFEKQFDRIQLNVNALDEYRPDLIEEKYDVLYKLETSTENPTDTSSIGFKRKFSEYFKLSNTIGGDLTTDNYFQSPSENGTQTEITENQTITNKTFQFFENNIDYFEFENGNILTKDIWKDYTDVMINKNQAIMNPMYLESLPNTPPGANGIKCIGQNQIFFVGILERTCILPIDDSVKSNKMSWGEH